MLLFEIIDLKFLATVTAFMTFLACYISSASRDGFWIYKSICRCTEMTESLLEVGTVFSYKFAEGSYGVEGFRLHFES